ncbi:MAG TPA: class I SAM-dependent methyltransferase [Trebonia sp.]|nr:class I SAM-dependent methyltransferase [Trebonia sp.]
MGIVVHEKGKERALLSRRRGTYGMIAGVSGIYDEPELYELACAYRDIPAEATALLAWCGAHFRGTAGETADSGVRTVLELAAGPAEHARELARRGLRAATLDLSPAMCSYAAARAKAAGVDVQVVQGDMRDFAISGADGAPVQFDAAITMLNSVCHLFTLDDLVKHLTAVRANLVPGGLYIVELTHPADFFAPEPRTSSEWTIDAPGVHADVHWGGRTDRIDPLTQVTKEHMTITATYDDGTIRTVSDVVPNRFWTLTEFTAAIALSNAQPAGPQAGIAAQASDPKGHLELVARYGDFDEATALDAPSAWRMILILRRA